MIDWLIGGEPYPVQIEALNRSMRGLIVQDEPGGPELNIKLPHYPNAAAGWCHYLQPRLGKTPTALNEIMLLRRDYDVRRAIIVSPPDYTEEWYREANKFKLPVPIMWYRSGKHKQAEKFIAEGEGVLIIGYELFRYPNTQENLEEWISEACYAAADESIKLKNNTTDTTKSVIKVFRECAYSRVMSGKPSTISPGDLWGQLRAAKYLNGVNYYQFRNRFVRMGGFKGKVEVGAQNEEELQELLSRVSFRAQRKIWGKKYENDYEIRSPALLPAQQKAYNEMREDFITMVGEDVVTVEAAVNKISKMHQVTSGFMYGEDRKVVELCKFQDTPKFKDLCQYLEEQADYKVIVVAFYKPSMRNLYKHLSKFNPAFLGGKVLMKEFGKNQLEEKDKFNNDPTCRVIVVQIDAGKYGHTLVGTPDDPCLGITFFESVYNLDSRSQVEERPQGYHQTCGLHIRDYLSTGVEKKMHAGLERKETLAQMVMGITKEEAEAL